MIQPDLAIETCGLTKAYGPVTAVDRLSLNVRGGEIYGFLGLNGAGKTTTIRMLLGMVRPTAGEAKIFGELINSGTRSVWSRVGYLVEKPSSYPELSVRENLEIMRRLRGLADTQCVDRVIELLALGEYADRRAGHLSTGNAQRLGLAKALLHNPELIILDEPANGLDPAGVVEARELLRDLSRKHGVTIFMSSHNLPEVSRLADRIGIIHRGRLIEEMDAGGFEKHQKRSLSLSTLDPKAACSVLINANYNVNIEPDGSLSVPDERAVAHPEDVARLLIMAGVTLTMLQLTEEDLEQHFMELIGKNGGV